MHEVLLSVDSVSHYYADGRLERPALRDVSCEVIAGARVAVIGPSGSGKSTLLHLMAGLDKPTNGLVAWPALGSETDLRPDQICLIPQTPSLLPTLTVLENVELCRLLSTKDEAQARPSALRALEALGLSTIADKLPEELSGGQVQRVAAARAIVCQPRLILADEPTGQLDSVTGSRLIEALVLSATSSGAALVVATHDITVADRMEVHWRIARGKLERDST
jgi:putative ABC transport system ATP-binding protein/lipoprotein-releasing system ATP-binding protein